MLSARSAVPADFPALARLWDEVFGDGEDFTSEFFARLWTPGCCRAVFEGGEAAAMGFCLRGPRAAGHGCGYIYAMATRPEYRGRGPRGRDRPRACGRRLRGGGLTLSRPCPPREASPPGTKAAWAWSRPSKRAARASSSRKAGWTSPASAARTTRVRRRRCWPRRGPAWI